MNGLLGGRIKALRSSKNLTQEQVATKIGISRQKYARIENGINNVTLEVLTKIAEILGVSVVDITKVLDETPVVAYRVNSDKDSFGMIFDMVDLFCANKNLYKKLTADDVD